MAEVPRPEGGTVRITEFCGYVRAGGQLSIIGVISVSLEIYVKLCYQPATSTTPTRLYGSALLRVEIHLLFFSKRLEKEVEYTFAGGGGANNEKSLLAQDVNTLLLPDPEVEELHLARLSKPQIKAAVASAQASKVDWARYEAAFID